MPGILSILFCYERIFKHKAAFVQRSRFKGWYRSLIYPHSLVINSILLMVFIAIAARILLTAFQPHHGDFSRQSTLDY